MLQIEPLVDILQEAFTIFRQRLMGNLFIFTRDRGLTMPQYGAMMRIYHTGGCGVSDIGSDLGITNSAASQMLERLVQLRLITRSEDPIDRRAKQIVLTDKGQELLREGTLTNHHWLEQLAGSMTAEEQGIVVQAVGILIEKARQFETSLN